MEPAMYSGAISDVGQPRKNAGMVGYPSRPNGRTPLAAFASSRPARSTGLRSPIVDQSLEVFTDDLAGDAARKLIENGNLPRHFVIRQALPNMLFQRVGCCACAVGQHHEPSQPLTVLL